MVHSADLYFLSKHKKSHLSFFCFERGFSGILGTLFDITIECRNNSESCYMIIFSTYKFDSALEIISVERVPLMCVGIRSFDMAIAALQFFLASIDLKVYNVPMNLKRSSHFSHG